MAIQRRYEFPRIGNLAKTDYHQCHGAVAEDGTIHSPDVELSTYYVQGMQRGAE